MPLDDGRSFRVTVGFTDSKTGLVAGEAVYVIHRVVTQEQAEARALDTFAHNIPADGQWVVDVHEVVAPEPIDPPADT